MMTNVIYVIENNLGENIGHELFVSLVDHCLTSTVRWAGVTRLRVNHCVRHWRAFQVVNADCDGPALHQG